MAAHCDPAHGANKVKSTTKKRGENKGIAKARKLMKRQEAETRNRRTPEHLRKRYRLRVLAGDDV